MVLTHFISDVFETIVEVTDLIMCEYSCVIKTLYFGKDVGLKIKSKECQ